MSSLFYGLDDCPLASNVSSSINSELTNYKITTTRKKDQSTANAISANASPTEDQIVVRLLLLLRSDHKNQLGSKCTGTNKAHCKTERQRTIRAGNHYAHVVTSDASFSRYDCKRFSHRHVSIDCCHLCFRCPELIMNALCYVMIGITVYGQSGAICIDSGR